LETTTERIGKKTKYYNATEYYKSLIPKKPGKFFYLNTVDKSGTTISKAMAKWSKILEINITNDEWKHLLFLID
jgi:hypothetical protein